MSKQLKSDYQPPQLHLHLLSLIRLTELTFLFFAPSIRYLIVIDDVDDIEEEQWDTISSAFEGNREGSRIVVTTTFRPTANRRSNANGCVYKMRTLGMTDSMTIALRGRCTAELVQGSETLLKKCGGLPLALVSVARQLSSEDEPTGQFCSELCSKLGSYLEREDGEPNFARLRDVLMDSYTSLSDLNVRTCLLYLSIFPNDRPLRKNVIIRRWLAEGYALSEDNTLSEQNVANGNFKTLIDRNIVLPVKTRKNAEIKTCKTHGIMHEFLLHRAMHEKFIMCSHAPSDPIVRHLFVNGHVCDDTKSTKTMKMDLSRVRSLTVSGNAGGAISDLGKYKLMRVLDLEACTDMNDSHVRKICKLWNLRYLSLSCNITNLPKEIAKLKLLETLVLSKTVVNVLPVEVIGLPCLVNLIGKFKLLDRYSMLSCKMERLSKNEGLEDLFSKSKLETLAGFVDDGSEKQGFLQLMVHMKNLKKVKIWCESTGDVGDNNHLKAELVKAIGQYIKTPMGAGDARSLSIDFQGVPGGSLNALQELCSHSTSLQETYYLSSLKLHDNLSTYPEFIGILSGLTELCLSSAIISRNLLSVLSEMPLLLYLKLIADEIDGFVIKGGTFQSLRRLCFLVRHQNPVLPIVEEGALPELVSLQLLCKHLTGPSGIEIRHLRMLQEIELHPEVSDPLRQEWEAAASNHPSRPIVLPFITCNDPVGNEPKNPFASPEESGHEEVVIQGQLAHEAPRPYVQHRPLSTCDCSGPSSEIDDSTYHEPMESTIGTEEAALETLIDEQLLIKEPLEHTPVQTTLENSMVQSRTNGILGSTSDHLVLKGKGVIRETASNNETYCRGGIKI